MSSQARNDRRDRAQFSGQGSRQQWIPKQPAASAVNPSQSGISEIPNDSVKPPQNGISGHSNHSSNHSSAKPDYHRRGRNGIKGLNGRPANPGRETERSKFADKRERKDPNLPQLGQEIYDKLMKGAVECMICYDMVGRSSPIWSCSSCYSIFHLSCIKKWARAPMSVDLSAEKSQGFNWRCPGCQSVQLTSSKEIRYVCFCGKRPDPPSDLYLTPHSCGEPCGKLLRSEIILSDGSKDDLCPHTCVLQCHPGPCPPCKAFAPPRSCPCGKKMVTTRCSERMSVLSCGQQCDKLLECWRHRCKQTCHVGSCDPCHAVLNASCFCKKKTEVLLCGSIAVKGDVKTEDGVFSCDLTCGKKLSCGQHTCGEICHPGPCPECDSMPSKIKSCHCGKTSLKELRKSCLDPIPTCLQTCEKLLPCGVHKCNEVCHAGDCPPCLLPVTEKCRCGSTSRTVECYRTRGEEKFTCERPCGRKKNCGRHRCSERCCPLSRNLSLGDWDPHFCQMPCGKKLRCGQHSCESSCHSGHCPPCLEMIFSDVTCACGRTSIPPPQPCGTPPPSCQLPCSVPQPCGHSASHSCHFGDCPPCSVPVAKECIGGHVILRNIPCGSKDIRCNKLCGKTRRCGMHACGRICHPPPCDAACGSEPGTMKASCGQVCGAPRRDCRHTCAALCHPSGLCPDVRCEFPVTIACSCGRITASVPCDAGGSGSDTVLEASIIQRLPGSLQAVELTGKKIPLGQRKLMCDDECAKLERKRVLADAFDITPPNLDALHFGENSAVSELLTDLYRRDPKWVLSVEERCKYLVLGKNRGSVSSIKVHVFCPMLKDKRDAVRLIAQRWKLAIGAAGWEPKRFIVLHVTSKSKTPSRLIGGKGSGPYPPPAFDPLVDMDPRLVVSFLDLPREADISALVLRFGGECELVWLNDKNALAVFSDPARAATAMRRLDHGSAYYGAAVVVQTSGSSVASTNAWGVKEEGGGLKGNPWKKAVAQESCWSNDDSWGNEEPSGGPIDSQRSVWKGKESSIAALTNRWSVLESEATSSFVTTGGARKNVGNSSSSAAEPTGGNPSSGRQQPSSSFSETEPLSEVADDWEKAYED